MASCEAYKRRDFIKIVTCVGIVVQATSVARAEDKLDPNDPYALAAGYVTNADNVDTAKYSKFEKGQHCKVCKRFTATSGGWGECAFFDSQVVIDTGWCRNFTPR